MDSFQIPRSSLENCSNQQELCNPPDKKMRKPPSAKLPKGSQTTKLQNQCTRLQVENTELENKFLELSQKHLQVLYEFNVHKSAITKQMNSITSGFCNLCGGYSKVDENLYIMAVCGAPLCLHCFETYGSYCSFHPTIVSQKIHAIFNRFCEGEGCYERRPAELIDVKRGHVRCRNCMEEWITLRLRTFATILDDQDTFLIECAKQGCGHRADVATIRALPSLEHKSRLES